MTPREYFLYVREATSRLKKPNISLRWRIHYTKQLIESSHTIVKKGYDKVLGDIFKDGLSAHSVQKRAKFEILSVIFWKDTTVIRTVAPYYVHIKMLEEINEVFNAASKSEQETLTEKYKKDSVLKELLQNIQREIVGASQGTIDLRSVTQVAKEYYGKKSILFQEER